MSLTGLKVLNRRHGWMKKSPSCSMRLSVCKLHFGLHSMTQCLFCFSFVGALLSSHNCIVGYLNLLWRCLEQYIRQLDSRVGCSFVRHCASLHRRVHFGRNMSPVWIRWDLDYVSILHDSSMKHCRFPHLSILHQWNAWFTYGTCCFVMTDVNPCRKPHCLSLIDGNLVHATVSPLMSTFAFTRNYCNCETHSSWSQYLSHSVSL